MIERMDITLFSAAGCGKCVATRYGLNKRQIPFTEVKVDRDPEVEKRFKAAFNNEPVHLPVLMAFRRDDDEVPDILLDFHPQYLDALSDPSVELPDPVATG
jgi:glutaredoxin